MWTLQRRYSKLCTIGVMHIAVKRKWLLFAVSCAQIFDKFKCRRLAQIVIEAKRLEIIGVDSRNEPQLHAAAYDLVDERDFLRQTQRVIQRHDITHSPDAYSTCARGGPDDIKAGRRDPAFIGAKMMFDTKAVIEAEFVAQLELTP